MGVDNINIHQSLTQTLESSEDPNQEKINEIKNNFIDTVNDIDDLKGQGEKLYNNFHMHYAHIFDELKMPENKYAKHGVSNLKELGTFLNTLMCQEHRDIGEVFFNAPNENTGGGLVKIESAMDMVMELGDASSTKESDIKNLKRHNTGELADISGKNQEALGDSNDFATLLKSKEGNFSTLMGSLQTQVKSGMIDMIKKTINPKNKQKGLRANLSTEVVTYMGEKDLTMYDNLTFSLIDNLFTTINTRLQNIQDPLTKIKAKGEFFTYLNTHFSKKNKENEKGNKEMSFEQKVNGLFSLAGLGNDGYTNFSANAGIYIKNSIEGRKSKSKNIIGALSIFENYTHTDSIVSQLLSNKDGTVDLGKTKDGNQPEKSTAAYSDITNFTSMMDQLSEGVPQTPEETKALKERSVYNGIKEAVDGKYSKGLLAIMNMGKKKNEKYTSITDILNDENPKGIAAIVKGIIELLEGFGIKIGGMSVSDIVNNIPNSDLKNKVKEYSKKESKKLSDKTANLFKDKMVPTAFKNSFMTYTCTIPSKGILRTITFDKHDNMRKEEVGEGKNKELKEIVFGEKPKTGSIPTASYISGITNNGKEDGFMNMMAQSIDMKGLEKQMKSISDSTLNFDNSNVSMGLSEIKEVEDSKDKTKKISKFVQVGNIKIADTKLFMAQGISYILNNKDIAKLIDSEQELVYQLLKLYKGGANTKNQVDEEKNPEAATDGAGANTGGKIVPGNPGKEVEAETPEKTK